jgi:hypothetical protein
MTSVHNHNRWSKAEAHLQKQFITVLVALSLPLAAIVSVSPAAAFTPAARPPVNVAYAVDYNAGASPDGASTGESPTGTTIKSDSGQPATAPGAAAAPSSGDAAPAPAAGDASLDSIWSEAPAPTTKSKAKKFGRKAKASKTKNNDGSSATGAPDSGSTAAGAASPGDLVPSSAATTQAPTTSAATTPPPAESSTSSDFGYPQASPPTDSGTKASNQPAAAPPDATASTRSSTALQPATVTSTSAAGTNTKSPAAESTPARTSSTGSSAAPAQSSGSGTAGGTNSILSTVKTAEVKSAPLCTTRTFFQSELVRSVSWPGVGPFKGDTDPNDLTDPQENKLTLQTEGDKLTSAELFLTHQPANIQGFINLQMVLDFMLEALGARDKKIDGFNAFMEKNKEKLLKCQYTETKPLTTTTGPYLISVASSAPGVKQPSYLIQVKSKNASSDTGKGHSDGGHLVDEPLPTKNTNTIAVNVPPSKRPVDNSANSSGTTSPTNNANTRPKQPKQPPAESVDTLKQEFVDTIRGWQSIKKAAVRNQDPSELSKILSGKALDKQTVAIGWLVKKKDYYELTPKGVVVDHYEELSLNPKRYAVFAQVKEMSKLIDQTTGKQLSESDDQYNVKYTIEKSGDHWTINDSDLIKPAGTADQSKGKTKPKR